MVVKTLNMFNIILISIWNLGILINCLAKKPTFENRPPWVHHQIRRYACANGGMHNDVPPNSLKDSNANPNMKTMEKGVGAHSITPNIFRVRRVCWSFKIMGIKTNDKCINYSYQFAQIKQQVD